MTQETAHTNHHGDRPRGLFRDENRLLTATLAVLLSVIVVINAAYIVRQVTKEPETPLYTTGKVLTSKQSARTPALSASVSSVTESDTPDPAFTLADGEVMLIMTLNITNHTAESQDFIPTSQLYVRTRQGDYRPLHASMQVKKPIAAGVIKPGQTVSGQISFGVPKAAPNPLLFIDTGWVGETPVVFDVLR